MWVVKLDLTVRFECYMNELLMNESETIVTFSDHQEIRLLMQPEISCEHVGSAYLQCLQVSCW